jgi:hypothetical protein
MIWSDPFTREIFLLVRSRTDGGRRGQAALGRISTWLAGMTTQTNPRPVLGLHVAVSIACLSGAGAESVLLHNKARTRRRWARFGGTHARLCCFVCSAPKGLVATLSSPLQQVGRTGATSFGIKVVGPARLCAPSRWCAWCRTPWSGDWWVPVILLENFDDLHLAVQDI